MAKETPTLIKIDNTSELIPISYQISLYFCFKSSKNTINVLTMIAMLAIIKVSKIHFKS